MSSLATIVGQNQSGTDLGAAYVSTSNGVETWSIYNANDSTIEDDNGTIRFKDVSASSPGRYQVSDTTSIPSSNSTSLNFLVADGKYVHCWTASGLTYKGYFQITYISGPTVTDGRESHSGIIPSAMDFTIRAPNPGAWYEKTGANKFKIMFYDQNEPSNGYDVTISYTSKNNQSKSHTETVSQNNGDYWIQLDTSNDGGVKHNSTISVSFNYAVVYNGVSYVINAAVKTFTYIANGPFSGSFTPASGATGQQISVYVRDDNPYPDDPVTVSYETTNGTKTNITLSASNTWQVMNSYPIYFTSTTGTAKIYNTDKDSATDDDIIAQAYYADPIEGSGGPRRYPLIMTNLFDRQRSDYAIGKTHKDLNTGNLF